MGLLRKGDVDWQTYYGQENLLNSMCTFLTLFLFYSSFIYTLLLVPLAGSPSLFQCMYNELLYQNRQKLMNQHPEVLATDMFFVSYFTYVVVGVQTTTEHELRCVTWE